MAESRLYSLRELQKAHFPKHTFAQVRYAVESRGITERQRVGIIRLFSLDDLPAIKSALQCTTGMRVEVANV